MMKTSKPKTINESSSYIIHVYPATGSSKGIPQGSRHVCSWIYMFYGIPQVRYHRGYDDVSPKQSPRPHENLQLSDNTPDQQVWYGCPENFSILHLLGE